MKGRHNKLFIGLAVVVVVLFILVVQQFRKTQSIVISASNTPLLTTDSIELPIATTDPILGNPGAPLTLMEFMDLGDAQSIAMHNTLIEFTLKHQQEVRLIWKYFPRSHIFGGDTKLAYRAAWCAEKNNPGKFWLYLTELLNNGGSFSQTTAVAAAQNLKLQIAPFTTCLDSMEAQTAESAAGVLAQTLQLPKPPILFINNKLLNWSSDLDMPAMLNSFIAQ